MKQKRSITGFTLLFLALVSSITFAAETYEINKQCRTQPQLMMKTVTITEDETIISFSFKAEKDYSKTGWINVQPPGHDRSFYITDVRKAKKYYLLDAEGIAISPNGNKLKIGDQLDFTLIFEKIPMKRFHLIEGKIDDKDMTSWHFTNVKLK